MSTEIDGWYLVELMGHRRLAGHVSDVECAGFRMLRIDINRIGADPLVQYYSQQAIYSLTPVTEETAVQFATRCVPEPVTEYDFPAEFREFLKRGALQPDPRLEQPSLEADPQPDVPF